MSKSPIAITVEPSDVYDPSGKMWMEKCEELEAKVERYKAKEFAYSQMAAKLDAVNAIREQYNNLIKQERGLVGANTVLDMIDAALEYKQGC